MEENKTVQNNAELTDEQLEQTVGGFFFIFIDTRTCPQCGKAVVIERTTCDCGHVFGK